MIDKHRQDIDKGKRDSLSRAGVGKRFYASLCFALLAFLAAPAQAQTIIDGSLGDLAPDYRAQVMRAVTKDFVDPVSAQFRNVRIARHMSPGYRGFCGEVNSKNRMGGYVGFKPFLVSMKGGDFFDPFIASSLPGSLEFVATQTKLRGC